MSDQVSFNFTGKRVLVTGASQGIGLSIAEAFHSAGAEVCITGTRSSADEYESDLSIFSYFQIDLADPQARIALAESVGDIDILVNNAGLSNEGGAEFEMEGFRHTLEVDLVAPSGLAFLFYESLAARGGSIVNIGSAACFLGIKNVPGYTASKSGLLGLTRALGDKWAPKGIRVNLVAPGYIETQLMSEFSAQDGFSESLQKILPMRRWGTPEDISPAVLFLASDGAAYITGQSIIADGGLMLR